MSKVLATAAEIAAAIGIGQRSLHTYFSTFPGAPEISGRLKTRAKGPGVAVWPKDEVLAWAREHKLGAKNKALRATGRQRAAWGSKRRAGQ